MNVAINDLSFQYPFHDRGTALEALVRFLNIFVEIKKRRYHCVAQILCAPIDKNLQLAPGQSLVQLIQALEQDQIALLFTLLVNSSYPQGGEPFCVDGKTSYACAYAREGAVISLCSHELFAGGSVKGTIGSVPFEIRNISNEAHIQQHGEALGCRIYEPNPKHGRKMYRQGGHDVSPMPLCVEEAQELLDLAIEVGGHLLAKRADTYFEFRCHKGIHFHGYQNDELPEHIKRAFDSQWRF